jgi:hypothetical protein
MTSPAGLLTPAPTVRGRPPSLGELKALPKPTHPVDKAPLESPSNRGGRRGRPRLRHFDFPWVGAVPDVVPAIIRQRAARGSWSARWSTAKVLVQHAHPTFATPTTAGNQAAGGDVAGAETGVGVVKVMVIGEVRPGVSPGGVLCPFDRPARGPNRRAQTGMVSLM